MALIQLKKVLVVDDEENIRHMLATELRAEGYEVTRAASAEEAEGLLQSQQYDVMLSDIRMPRVDGLQLLDRVQQKYPDMVVVMMSAYGNVDTAIEAMKRGAYDYIAKPFKPDEVILLLRKAEERERLKRENRSLRLEKDLREGGMGKMVGRSERMQEVFKTIYKIAEYKTTVLIHGESGTGKELVARAIHDHSPRADKAFVAVNCGAIPENLLESELFGHVRGAFTGAIRNKKGRFEMAHGGTLFLDEVGELSASFQVKLLRVLQEKRFEMVGGERTIEVDVRIISATNRNVRELIREGSFREDLFYRLCVFPLELPPLRERREDIPPIVEHALEKVRQETGSKVTSVSTAAMETLMDYGWPGNVRELINAVQFASVLCQGDEIQPHNLPPEVRHGDADAVPVAPPAQKPPPATTERKRKLDWAAVDAALAEANGNKVKAAKILGVGRATLYRFLKDRPKEA